MLFLIFRRHAVTGWPKNRSGTSLFCWIAKISDWRKQRNERRKRITSGINSQPQLTTTGVLAFLRAGVFCIVPIDRVRQFDQTSVFDSGKSLAFVTSVTSTYVNRWETILKRFQFRQNSFFHAISKGTNKLRCNIKYIFVQLLIQNDADKPYAVQKIPTVFHVTDRRVN